MLGAIGWKRAFGRSFKDLLASLAFSFPHTFNLLKPPCFAQELGFPKGFWTD